jgi:hypothetical protein
VSATTLLRGVDRAAGAPAHAKYKELPEVRARRIKTIEADNRKQDRAKADAEKWLKLWGKDGLTLEQARALANYCHLYVCRGPEGQHWSAWDVLRPDDERYNGCPGWTVEQVQAAVYEAYPRTIERCDRWIEHYENRLAYERAMLAEARGIAADRTRPGVGGAVRCDPDRYQIGFSPYRCGRSSQPRSAS